MSEQPATRLTFSPGVRAFIPMLYAAWSDRVLTPTEIRGLREQAAQLPFLTDEDKAQLLAWSNPARPPGRDLFKYWEISCKEAVADRPNGSPDSLTELGLKLAPQLPKEARAGLEALEAALGPVNKATFENLFTPSEAKVLDEEQERADFSIAQLRDFLDGPYAGTKDFMRTLLQDPFFDREYLPLKEDHRDRVLRWCKLLAEQGLGAMSFPEAYGGKDDMGNYGAAFEMLGYHDLSLAIKFGVQFGLWGGAVAGLGTQRHHDAYLKDIGNMALPGCFAMTETGHGSNVRGLETTATYDPESDTFVVHTPREEAGKEYIGNALHGRMGAVFAQLFVDGKNHGVHTLIVPLRDESGALSPGIRIEDNGYKLGLNGVDNGRIWFDQVRVPRENLLDRFGQVTEKGAYESAIENPSRRFFTMLGTLVGGRVCVPRVGLSAAKKALTIAVRYGARRRQFAPSVTAPEVPILDYPSHQRRLFPLVAKAYALHFALDHLLDRYVKRKEEEMREIETLAAGMKAYTTWFTTAAIQESREACGGKGYLAVNELAALKADTDIFTTFEGDNTVLMQLVAKGVLSEFKQAFHEDGQLATLRYIGRRLNTVLTEQNPFVIRNTDEVHLRSPEFHQAAFSFRERRLTYSLAQRLRGHIKEGRSASEAANLCQTHMLALAEAFIEREVLAAAYRRLEETPAQLRPVLEKLLALYALHTIETHKGWYLEQDYLAGSKSKAIRRGIDGLCAELRPEAVALVDAFGIPEKLLAAPIAVREPDQK